jgi:hypothetical protein
LDEFQNHDRVLPPNNDGYTSHLCFGGEQKEGFHLLIAERYKPTDWSKRTCVFRNLGVSPEGTLLYHVNTESPPVWDYLNGLPVTEGAEVLARFEHVYGFAFVQVAAAFKPDSYAHGDFPDSEAFFFKHFRA